jgi:hypothetical protein
VGIGTSTPSQRLHIIYTNANTYNGNPQNNSVLIENQAQGGMTSINLDVNQGN